MSLNGLDDPKVAEAYHGAIAEGGGWFLLKYTSRDAVEVLARGTGGTAEARGAVAQYEDKSPLYGFLLYRRRKVLIKYIPEGTSRLLQARVAVHFTAVSEKFTPHDTTVSITSAEELSDAALASACSLHTAVPSSCSSSGSSRRKLDEITEDAEEGSTTATETASQARPTTAASTKPTITRTTTAESGPIPQVQVHEEPAPVEPPEEAPALERTKTTESLKPTTSHAAAETVPEAGKPEPQTSDYRNSLKAYDELFLDGPDPRLSSQTARPAMSDLYAEVYAKYNKPKVKLGPRPKVSLDVKRPHTSGPGAQNASRPVSSLPAGMRVANRKTMEPKRPKSRDSSTVPSIAFPPPPPVPAMPEMPLLSPTHPPKSPASVRSLPVSNYRNHHKSGASQEKQRLMKALELRKKQMKAKEQKSLQVPEKQSDDATGGAEVEDAKIDDTVTVSSSAIEPVEAKETGNTVENKEDPTTVETQDEKEAGNTVESKEDQTTVETQDEVSSSKSDNPTPTTVKSPLPTADSGVEIMASQAETDDLHSAASASSPTSAQTQGSSCAPSTRPSSISEDDNLLSEQTQKSAAHEDGPTAETEKPSEPSLKEDEEDSIESSPTVVPETTTPVPSVEIAFQQDPQPESVAQAPTSDDAVSRKNKRESMILMPPSDQDDVRARRQSKRESMLFVPANELAHLHEAFSGRDKRQSGIFSGSKRQSYIEFKEKRRALVDPIPIHLSAENSEAEYLSDDSFMEELQSAKFEEAKPISVSKSPITPVFPRKASISEVSLPERSSSYQMNKPGRESPELFKGRKSSGPWLTQTNTDSVVVAKKINVSSGISQRIKALAEKSNRDSSASVSPVATPDASNSIVAQRKSSFFSTPPSGNSPEGKPINRLNRASFVPVPSLATPDRKSVLQPPPSRDGPVFTVKQGSEKPDSVQVTARIVRNGPPPKPTLTMPTENTPLELQHSEITIDHQKSINSGPRRSKSPVKAGAPKMEPTSPRPPSSAHSREQSSSALPRSSSESSWRSFGRRLSESRSGAPPPRSQSTHSFESMDEKRDEKKDKKESRTSKMFKRMSSISSISRKNQAVSPISPDENQHFTLPSLREPPPAVQVGDLNVQFPDTLLWKRRWVEIDASGNLVLSLSKSNEQSKGITKRFHLSEFRTPYAPDQDRQELPNSVVLDFIDGRTLQCACETYVAQIQILQILREAHDAWIAYNQGL